MHITIDHSIIKHYNEPDVSSVDFHNLLMMVELRNYSLSVTGRIDDEVDINHYDLVSLYGFMEKDFNNGHSNHLCDCTVKQKGELEYEKKIFSLSESLEYAKNPPEIVVENAYNDGRFILTIAKYFAPELRLDELKRDNQLHIDPASGSGFEDRFKEYESTHHNKKKFLRCLAIMDSDRKYPGDDTSKTISLYNKLSKIYSIDNGYYSVQFHLLDKRAMENYMPNQEFQSEKKKLGRKWCDAYLNLTAEQKDYYYTSQGFNHDIEKPNLPIRPQLTAGAQHLYASVSDTSLKELSTGPNGKTKSLFPELFDTSPYVNKATLQERLNSTNPNEFNEIIDKIIQIL